MDLRRPKDGMFSNLSEFRKALGDDKNGGAEALRDSEFNNQAQELKLEGEALGCEDHTCRQTAVDRG